MKAIVCRSFAPLEALTLEDMPLPIPVANEVRIAVAAAGINFPDGLMVQGKYQAKPPFPFVPGSEVAGVIDALGSAVHNFRVGERVVAFCGIGGYAEHVVAPATQVYPLPAAIEFAPAAGFLITYGTSYHAFKDRARLRSGETVLVLGAAGGVGLTAVELAKAMGARVIAAASSAAKLALARDYGADEGIDYSREDLRERLKALTDGRGVDVVYDPVGGAHSEAALRSLAWEGRYLVVGFAAGDIPKLAANILLLKSAAALGVFWGQSLKMNPVLHDANLRELLDWYAAGKLRPHISETHPLAAAVQAMQRVMQRHAQGKVILTIN